MAAEEVNMSIDQNIDVAFGTAVPLEVISVRITEALNEPFVAQVRALAPPDCDADALAGVSGAVGVRLAGGWRKWSGAVRRARVLDPETANGAATVLLDVVPVLWFLSQRRNYRTFQVISEIEIVTGMLREASIPFELRLDPARHARREMRVQYGESDLAFIHRMLEDAGITYWFEDVADVGSVVVFSDEPQSRSPSAALAWSPEGIENGERPDARRVELRRRLRPGRYTLSDVDIRESADRQPIVSAIDAQATALEQLIERFHHSPGVTQVEGSPSDTPTADERIAIRSDLAFGRTLAQKRLAGERRDAKTLSFASRSAACAPGSVVTVLGHRSRELGPERPWLIERVELEADRQVVGLRVRAVSALTPQAPVLVTPRPDVDNLETAVTICRGKEEIDPDEYGRVRVHFPWDRGAPNGSAWIPVSQAWAGKGFGVVNLPRAGQELLVDTLSGNPDQPIVVGRLFNALQPVPYALPANKTQSGWKTNSTNGTGGYNELMMEDSRENQLMRMQAERDLETVAVRDENRNVGRDRSVNVVRNESRLVKKNQTSSVQGNVQKSVGGDQDAIVGDDTSKTYAKNFLENVSAARFDKTDGSSVTHIGGNDLVEVEEEHLSTTLGKHIIRVGDTRIEMEASQIYMVTDGGAKVTLKPEQIEIDCDIFEVSGSSSWMATAEALRFDFGKLEVDGRAKLKVDSSMITLNGGGKPFSRLLDKAPAKLDDGSMTVLVGE